MLGLPPLRHSSTLPNFLVRRRGREGPESAQPFRSPRLRRRSPFHPEPTSEPGTKRQICTTRFPMEDSAKLAAPSGITRA